jgi:hypothetical protein
MPRKPTMLRHLQYGLCKILAARTTSTLERCLLVETETGQEKPLLCEPRY